MFGALGDVRFAPDCDCKSRHRLSGRTLLSSATEAARNAIWAKGAKIAARR
jgi:hypothetical protein